MRLFFGALEDADYFLATQSGFADHNAEELKAGIACLAQFSFHGGGPLGGEESVFDFSGLGVGEFALKNDGDFAATEGRFEYGLATVQETSVADLLEFALEGSGPGGGEDFVGFGGAGVVEILDHHDDDFLATHGGFAAHDAAKFKAGFGGLVHFFFEGGSLGGGYQAVVKFLGEEGAGEQQQGG